MKLKQLIDSARVNVFESARFYYWVLWVLIGYSILREIVQKSALVYNETVFIMPREIIGILFFVFALCSIISTWLLRKQIDKKFFVFVGILVGVSGINEVRFALTSTSYDVIVSLTQGQLYYVTKIIFPFLFLGFWPLLDEHNTRTAAFIETIEKLFLINAGFLLTGGLLLGLPISESYPLSGRWGYNGLLLDRVVTQFIYGLLLLHTWRPEKPFDLKSLLYLICLLVSGQKAGFLWVGLFFLIDVIKRPLWRTTIVGLSLFFVPIFPYIVKQLIPFSTFWKNVSKDYGAWEILFSTRNTNVLRVWGNNKNETNCLDVLFGGIARFPSDIEMLPFDVFIYFGAFGLIASTWFFLKWVSSWKWAIPLIVTCFAGGVFGSIIMILLYGFFKMSSLTFKNKLKH
jgi:hypothetical protein